MKSAPQRQAAAVTAWPHSQSTSNVLHGNVHCCNVSALILLTSTCFPNSSTFLLNSWPPHVLAQGARQRRTRRSSTNVEQKAESEDLAMADRAGGVREPSWEVNAAFSRRSEGLLTA